MSWDTAAQPAPVAKDLLITQFRLDGSGGSADDFVELFNTTSRTIDLTGYRIAHSAGYLTIPSGLIEPGGHFLVAGSGYGLGAYATPDYTGAVDFVYGTGVAVLGPTGTTNENALPSSVTCSGSPRARVPR